MKRTVLRSMYKKGANLKEFEMCHVLSVSERFTMNFPAVYCESVSWMYGWIESYTILLSFHLIILNSYTNSNNQETNNLYKTCTLFNHDSQPETAALSKIHTFLKEEFSKDFRNINNSFKVSLKGILSTGTMTNTYLWKYYRQFSKQHQKIIQQIILVIAL